MGWWSSRTPASRRSAAAQTPRPRPWPGHSTVQYSTAQYSTVPGRGDPPRGEGVAVESVLAPGPELAVRPAAFILEL